MSAMGRWEDGNLNVVATLGVVIEDVLEAFPDQLELQIVDFLSWESSLWMHRDKFIVYSEINDIALGPDGVNRQKWL